MVTRYQPGDFIARDFEVRSVRCGGMGEVYLCYDYEFKMPFAVKTFQDKFLSHFPSQERFIREALTWNRLGTHQHIVRAFFVEQIDNKPYIFLEFVASSASVGPDLRSWLRRSPLSVNDALDFAAQFCLGMEHAHSKFPGGLVHRDIKPENILIGRGNILKITDFGLVKAFQSMASSFAQSENVEVNMEHASLTRIGSILGTPPYMSPEQCRGETLDVRSDIYAFGCVLNEMITSRYIFPVRTLKGFVHAHISEIPDSPRQFDPSIPTSVEHILLKCLEKDPNKRYQNFGELSNSIVNAFREVTKSNWMPPSEQVETSILNRINEIVGGVQNKFQMQADGFWDFPRGGRLERYHWSWNKG